MTKKLPTRRGRYVSASVASLLLLTLLLSGCVLSLSEDGSRLRDEAADQIIVGKSTRADVARLLGPPDIIVYSNKEHDPLFEQAYQYKRTTNKGSAMCLWVFATCRSDTKYDRITVFFDQNGVVEHIGSRLDGRKAEYGAPW